jgi:predicted small metal-binding protein
MTARVLNAGMPYAVECSQDDEFMIQSDDESEVVEHVKQHASEKHGMDLSDDDAREMIHSS